MKNILKILFNRIFLTISNIRGEIQGDLSDKPCPCITQEIEIDGIVYRVCSEFNGKVDLQKALTDWAMDKAIEQIKNIA